MKNIVKWENAAKTVINTGNAYYLGTANGNDSNSGLSRDLAWNIYR
jgi:hypothetical protein